MSQINMLYHWPIISVVGLVFDLILLIASKPPIILMDPSIRAPCDLTKKKKCYYTYITYTPV